MQQTYHGRNAVKIFATLMIVYAFFSNHYLTTNDASRFALTMALVEKGSPQIGVIKDGQALGLLRNVTHPAWLVKDFAVSGDKVFSDKGPLGSILGMPVYWAASRAGAPMPWVIFLTSLLTAGVCTALTAVVIYRLVPLWALDERRAVLIALAYGLGTMALFYGTVFFSHGITAFCCITSFYFLAKVQLRSGGPGAAVAAGLFAGSAFTSDYFSAITIACLLAYAVAGRKHIFPFLLGCSIPVALLLLYNNWTFGAPWPLSYSYANLFGSLHASGFYGLTIPGGEGLARLRELLFFRWGFFFTNIIVIFSIYAFRRFLIFRRPAIMVLVMSAGYLYLNSCQGWLDAYSARFFMPLLPFLMLPMIFIDFSNRWMRNSFFILLGFSVVINFVGADCHLREYQAYQCEIGMQNLAAYLFSERGIEGGFRNYFFVIPFAVAPWLIPARKKKMKN